MKTLFLIIGAPGSGKTTDAQLIAEHSEGKIAHYSTGDLLRAEIAKGSEQGKIIEKFTSKGNLVPLEIVVKTIITAIMNAPKDIIVIDGYPRSIEQMEELDRVLKSQNEVCLKGVVEIEVSEETARQRVLGRARGDDDNTEVFNNRMSVYLTPLQAIQDFYQNSGVLTKINGERTIKEIVDDLRVFIHSKII